MQTIDVFILTSEWTDSDKGNQIRFYGISDAAGPVEILVDYQQPVCFIPEDAVLPEFPAIVDRKSLPLFSFDDQKVDAIYFHSQQALRELSVILEFMDIKTFEADLRPDRRYLMERFINAQMRVSGKGLRQGKLLQFHNPKVEPCDMTPALRVASLDIETGVESGKLYSIAVDVQGGGEKHQHVFMLGESDEQMDEQLTLLSTEKKLLLSFFDWFREIDPDIIIGWHVIGFDLDFLERKCREFNLRLDMARSRRRISLRKRERAGYIADISGRVVVDGPQALRAAFYQFEDFTLETVARDLLGVGKTITPDHDKIEEIERLFASDKRGLAEYNLQDCVLVSEIFQKTGLLDLYVRRSQISGMLLNQVGLSVAAFDHHFLPLLHRKGYVAPNKDDVIPQGHAAGGYVMEPLPGIYDNVIVLDFKSLYPSIIQSFKIDPFSRLKAENETIETPDGFTFSATDNLLPGLIDTLMQQRQKAKQNKDQPLSQAIKILMNSFYGVMGSYGCRFYHQDLPSAITGTGQWLLKRCREYLQEHGFQVLYGDTDSLFVHLTNVGEQDADATGHELAAKLNEYWREELAAMGVESHLEMEYEKHYRKFVLPLARAVQGGARKRYAGLRKAGEKEKLEFVGMEYVRSDWTPLARDFQYQLYHRLLTDEPITEWIRNLVRRIYAGELDDKLIYTKRLRKKASAYEKNISPQVRAALLLENDDLRVVKYRITRDGPIPIELPPKPIDYSHYVEKQLKPIADSLLGLIGQSFSRLIYPAQLDLFES